LSNNRCVCSILSLISIGTYSSPHQEPKHEWYEEPPQSDALAHITCNSSIIKRLGDGHSFTWQKVACAECNRAILRFKNCAGRPSAYRTLITGTLWTHETVGMHGC